MKSITISCSKIIECDEWIRPDQKKQGYDLVVSDDVEINIEVIETSENNDLATDTTRNA